MHELVAPVGVCLDALSAAWLAKFLFLAIGVAAGIFIADLVKGRAQ